VDDLAESAASLGMRMHSQSLVLRGRLTSEDWKAFLAECAKAMGMTPVCDAVVWEYPIEGKGGSGITAFQPIVESFIALDTWSSHDGAYLFIASCRKFDVSQLVKPIQRFALWLDDSGAPITLRLK
jgi:hypothetical protein